MAPHLRPHPALRRVGAAAAARLGSQQHARRNALVASTALMERRQERLEVEDFLAARGASRAGHQRG